jgi:hypothetical protein
MQKNARQIKKTYLHAICNVQRGGTEAMPGLQAVFGNWKLKKMPLESRMAFWHNS